MNKDNYEEYVKKIRGLFSHDIILTLHIQEIPLRIVISLIVLWGLLFSAGCQTNFVNTEAPPELPPSPVVEPTSTFVPVLPPQGDPQMNPSPTIPANPGLQSLIDKAREHLAQRLSISATQINLVEAMEVEWSDASLDCPQPGMDYIQVLTPGYRILLEASGNEYEYHSNRDTYVVYCQDSIPPILPKP